MQSGIHPDWDLEDYLRWLRVAKDVARRSSTCTRTRRWRSRTCATSPACRRARSSRGCATPGSDSTPGTAAEVLHDGVRERISPNKLPVARWVEIIEASHAAGLRSTVTVMFGHVEEPWELAEHMRVVRELQERTGGFTEFVPLSLHPVPHAARPHARRRGDLARGEPQAHRGLPPRARAHVPTSRRRWVKMGLDAATEALRWGVNDLGGTLMEENISRLAGCYHGVRLDPPELIAAAHARRPPGGRAHDALRHPRALPAAGARRGLAGASARELTEQEAGSSGSTSVPIGQDAPRDLGAGGLRL